MFVPIEPPPAPPKEVMNHEYDHIVNWLDRKTVGSFATTVEIQTKHPPTKALFEDGSWRYQEYTGCLRGWDCDTDGEFASAGFSCKGGYVGINKILFQHPLQYEFDCYNDEGITNITLHLEAESGDYESHEYMIRYNHSEQRIYLPIMFGFNWREWN